MLKAIAALSSLLVLTTGCGFVNDSSEAVSDPIVSEQDIKLTELTDRFNVLESSDELGAADQIDAINLVFSPTKRRCIVEGLLGIVGADNLLPVELIPSTTSVLTSAYVDYTIPEFVPTIQQQTQVGEALEECVGILEYTYLTFPGEPYYECLKQIVEIQQLQNLLGEMILYVDNASLNEASTEFQTVAVEQGSSCSTG